MLSRSKLSPSTTKHLTNFFLIRDDFANQNMISLYSLYHLNECSYIVSDLTVRSILRVIEKINEYFRFTPSKQVNYLTITVWVVKKNSLYPMIYL